MKMRCITFVLGIIMILSVFKGGAQESITIVPYPKEVKVGKGQLTFPEGLTIGYMENDLEPLAGLLENDFYTLFEFSARVKKGRGDILLGYDRTLREEEYILAIDNEGISIKGSSYNAVCMAATSLLQLAKLNAGKLILPLAYIRDRPTLEYRGVMLDVARQWHNIETVKQVVELCRWYKIRYMQFHLTDDQSFTFPSAAYPGLAGKDRHYAMAELQDLVEFAKKRGVIIIPEFDAPGHTTAMRRNMPDLFGAPGLGVINMADERVYEAMETIIKEMMDVFYTAPYFHIGADEAWLGEFEKAEATKAYIEKKGFDNAHDIYLDFIVRMHNIVKKYDKKTLIWESFSGNGSKKVKIPRDIIVFAWETAYQRPESLLKNGYTIINASWKPAYVTPGFRWHPSYIYHWNIRRWENHWNATPAFHNPIQLGAEVPIFGGQMCSWEMSEEQQIASLHQRVPAISEVFWNGDNKKDYAHYRKRYLVTDAMYNQLIFPVKIKKEGFTEPDYEGIYYNRENRFGDKATIVFEPMLPETKITYTTDGEMPAFTSEKIPHTLTIDKDFKAKLGVFNKRGNSIGYEIVNFELNPIVPKVEGGVLSLRDTIITRPRVAFIDNVSLSFKNLKKGAVIRYTTDGERPALTSQLYSAPIRIGTSQVVKALCFYEGKPFGKMYESRFIKKDYEKNMTTRKKVLITHGDQAEKAEDGFVDRDAFWDSREKASALTIDLGAIEEITKIALFTYWDGHRFYQYNIALSIDGKTWTQVIDRSDNTEQATPAGYVDEFPKQPARYIRANMLRNSANRSMHIVEMRAY